MIIHSLHPPVTCAESSRLPLRLIWLSVSEVLGLARCHLHTHIIVVRCPPRHQFCGLAIVFVCFFGQRFPICNNFAYTVFVCRFVAHACLPAAACPPVLIVPDSLLESSALSLNCGRARLWSMGVHE